MGWNAATTVATVNPGQTATYQLTLSSSTLTGTATLTCVAGKEYSNPMPTVPAQPVASAGATACGGGGRGGGITQPVNPGPPAVSGVFSVWASMATSSTETQFTGAYLTLNVNP